jgi:type IX secretion system PorP/SprF family membrane protein
MLRKLYIGIGLLVSMGVWGQNTLIPSVSNYHLTWTTINPAFAGFRDVLSATTLYRSRLYGSQGPLDMQLNVHSPVGTSKVAIGGVVAYNNTPPANNLYSLMGNYAYRLKLGAGSLSLGLSAGVYAVNNDMTSVLIRDAGDPSFPFDVYSRWLPNFGAGVLWYARDFFVGLSIPELLSIPGPEESLSADPGAYRYILTGAYHINPGGAVSLKPSAIVDISQASTSFKASLNAGFLDGRFFLGAAYDYPNYAFALLNVQVSSQWLVGYAYTIGMGDVRKYLGGSHEIVIRWEWQPELNAVPDDPFYF